MRGKVNKNSRKKPLIPRNLTHPGACTRSRACIGGEMTASLGFRSRAQPKAIVLPRAPARGHDAAWEGTRSLTHLREQVEA